MQGGHLQGGHMQGGGQDWLSRWPAGISAAAAAFGAEIWSLDQSEIGGFDYLHAPDAAIAESQALTAGLFGVDRTLFLINGSTVGNLAAVLSTCGDGDMLVMGRASHRSVYGALMLSGARGLYVPPAWHDALDGWFGVDVEAARQLGQEALAQGHRIGAVHVTNPSYFGFAPHLEKWRDLAHGWGVPLIVDEAHGTHLCFDDRLPPSGTQVGADIVIQSPHKTAGSLTQASWLHVSGDRVDTPRLSSILGQIQSSSPSSLLTASLDLAQAQLRSAGPAMVGHAVDLSYRVRAQLQTAFGPDVVVGTEALRPATIAGIDVTKLIISAAPCGVDGYELARRLGEGGAGVPPLRPEFADPARIVCSISWADTDATIDTLLAGLRAVGHQRGSAGSGSSKVEPTDMAWRSPSVALTVREASTRRSEHVSWDDAIGRVSADYLIPYPPGIPAVVPGEQFDASVLTAISTQHRLGARVVGADNPNLTTLRVISD
jgi:arginine/lysine/ornithine decarboxylase